MECGVSSNCACKIHRLSTLEKEVNRKENTVGKIAKRRQIATDSKVYACPSKDLGSRILNDRLDKFHKSWKFWEISSQIRCYMVFFDASEMIFRVKICWHENEVFSVRNNRTCIGFSETGNLSALPFWIVGRFSVATIICMIPLEVLQTEDDNT